MRAMVRPPQARRFQYRRHELSTSTITHDGRVVPWLAADGPLSYSPEEPPRRDYYFQYGWVFPSIFAEHVNKRGRYYFGASHKDDARELLSFWDGPGQRAHSA